MKTTELARLFCPMAALILTGLLFLGAGCQSTSASKSAATKPPPTSATLVGNPLPVVVQDFKFNVSELRTDQGLLAGREGPAKRVLGEIRPQEAPAQKAARLAALLSETIAKELAALRIPATRAAAAAPLPANGFVVAGEFLEVDEGNRLRRAIVGFGAGASEVLVQVAVYDLAQSRDQPVLVYGTGSGSKPMPGAVVTLNPYAMAAKYVLSRNATEKDVRNLGEQVAKDLAQIEAEPRPSTPKDQLQIPTGRENLQPAS